MARFRFKGLDEYEKKLATLGDKSEETAKRAIYAAADIMADAIKDNIKALPVLTNQRGSESNKLAGVTKPQKDGLLDGFGITPFRNDMGYIDVKLGFDGYNGVRTEKYPRGQPNAMIARSVNSGTTFRQKTKFVDKAVSKSRKAAVEKMQEVLDEEIEKIMK